MDSMQETVARGRNEPPRVEGESCPTADLLAALLAGHLDAHEAIEIHRHVDLCEACLDLLAELATSAVGTADLGSSLLPRQSPLIQSPDLTAGSVLYSRFLLVRSLGSGATGVVFQAQDLQQGKAVALKLLSQPSEEVLWRFKREFRLCRLLNHPQLVQAHELFTDGRWWWFTMELVEGSDLLSWLAASPKDGDATQLRLAFAQIVTGLQALHQAGFVHRDVKPQNLRVTPDGRVVIIDLGLATEVGDSSGDVVGTPVYMSPEQSVGGRTSPASDWFSLGILLRTALGRQFDNIEAEPEDLRTLHRELTHTNAAQRPSSIQIIARLGAERSNTSFFDSSALDDPMHSALEELEDALLLSSSGSSVVLQLLGADSRTGRLLRIFAQRTLRLSPATIYLDRGSSAPEHIPLASLDGLIDALIGLVRTWSIEELRSVFSTSLAELFDVFPSFLQIALLRTMADARLKTASREELTDLPALLSVLFRNLATRGPLILVIREAQYIDSESRKILEQVLSVIASPGLLLVLTGHADPSTWSHCELPTRVRTVCSDPNTSSSNSLIGTPVEPILTLALAVLSPQPATHGSLRRLRQELLHAGLGTERLVDGVLLTTLNRRSSSEVMDMARPTLRFAEGLILRGLQVAIATDPNREHALTRAYHMMKQADAERNEYVVFHSGLMLDSLTADLHIHASPTERLLLGRPTSFHGRVQEQATIASHLHQCTSQVQSACLVIVGEPGLGKTRLCQESLQSNVLLPHQRLSAECDPMSSGDTLGLIRQTLRGLCLLALPFEEETLRLAQVARFRKRIARSLLPEDAERVVEFLGEVCQLRGLESPRLQAAREDSRIMQAQVRRAVCDFLRAECTRGPVVWFIDNIHWADAASMRLLRDALHELPDLPLIVVGTARTEVHQRFPWLWEDPQYRVLMLSALESAACRQIVQGACGDTLQSSMVEALVERSGGNPLFLEELVRASSTGQTDHCPESVRMLLHGRLSQRMPAEVDLLGAAAVIGETFSLAQLSSLLMLEPPQTLVVLERLILAEWLVRAQLESASDHWFRFRHALLREVAYERQSAERRQQHHLAFGRFLTHQVELEALRAAEHLEQGGDRSRAVHYYAEAAERALQGGDNESVEVLANRGLACDEQGTEPRLQIVWMEAHGWRRDPLRSARYITAILQSSSPGSVNWLRAQVHRQFLAQLGQQPEVVLQAHQDMLGCCPTKEAATAYGYAVGGGTYIIMLTGQLSLVESSIAHLVAVLAPYESQSPVVSGWIDTCRSYWLGYCRDDASTARNLAQTALLKFDSVGDELNACIPKLLLACHAWALGDLPTAERLLTALVNSKHILGGFLEMQPGLLAVLLIEQGKLDSAKSLIDRFLNRANAQESFFREGWVRWALAEYQTATGDLLSAEQEVRRALEQLAPMLQQQLPVMTLHAEILLKQGRVREAIEQARETLATYHRLSALGYRGARAERVLAEALLSGGYKQEAASILRTARDRIHTGARRIADEEGRQRFLTTITEHRRIESMLTGLGAEFELN